jgi:hypothetical protein
MNKSEMDTPVQVLLHICRNADPVKPDPAAMVVCVLPLPMIRVCGGIIHVVPISIVPFGNRIVDGMVIAGLLVWDQGVLEVPQVLGNAAKPRASITTPAGGTVRV